MTNCIWLLAAFVFCGDRAFLHFSSTHCPACRQIQPAIDQLNAEGWAVRSIDSARDTASADKWHVRQIPTIIVVENGREIDRVVGSLEVAELKRRLTGNVSSMDSSGTTRNSTKVSSSGAGSNYTPYRPLNRPNISQDYGPNHPLFKSNRTSQSEVAGSIGVNHPYYSLYNKTRVASNDSRAVKPQTNRAPKRTPKGDKLPDAPECLSATVRIRIQYEQSESVGTGTIIGLDREEAIVLTCGHLFRSDEAKTNMTVELFRDDGCVQIAATLIDYRNDEVDLGLIKFRHPGSVAKVPLLPRNEKLQEDQYVFSIGCDRGDAPSRRDTFITKLNRFLGPSNVEIAGAPVQGRSGGGLFDVMGRLVGVCIAADNDLDEGMFVGPEAIYDQLAKNQLNRLYE